MNLATENLPQPTDGHSLPWPTRPLGSLVSLRTGPFGSSIHKSDYITNGIPVINPSHIIDSRLVQDPSISIREEKALQLQEFRLHQGDIIIGRRGEMGRCAVVGHEQQGWLCGTGSMIIRTSGEVEPEFLQRILSSQRAIKAITEASVGTTMINFNQATLLNLEVPLPELRVQIEIASALRDIDDCNDALVRLVAKKREIKQAAMQQLLTGRTRLPGFADRWESRRLGELVRLRTEKFDPRRGGADRFCIELEHLEPATGRLTGHTRTHALSSIKTVFHPGDVLFGKLRAYLRKFWLADREGVCSTEIWCLQPLQDLVGDFLFQIVQTDAFIETASTAYGTHMPRSDWNVVKHYPVFLPARTEQEAIAEVLSDMDSELVALEARLAKTRALKRAMMEALLSGRVRLV